MLRYWKGSLSILIAVSAPFSAWATGESSLRATLVLALISGLTAGYSWIDQTISTIAAEKAERAELPVSSSPPAPVHSTSPDDVQPPTS